MNEEKRKELIGAGWSEEEIVAFSEALADILGTIKVITDDHQKRVVE